MQWRLFFHIFICSSFKVSLGIVCFYQIVDWGRCKSSLVPRWCLNPPHPSCSSSSISIFSLQLPGYQLCLQIGSMLIITTLICQGYLNSFLLTCSLTVFVLSACLCNFSSILNTYLVDQVILNRERGNQEPCRWLLKVMRGVYCM